MSAATSRTCTRCRRWAHVIDDYLDRPEEVLAQHGWQVDEPALCPDCLAVSAAAAQRRAS